MNVWNFVQDEIFGMDWLYRLLGSLLELCGLDTDKKIGGSLQFFLFDMIKIMVLLGVLIFVISYEKLVSYGKVLKPQEIVKLLAL